MYSSFRRLREDYRANKVPFEEYKKYLGRLLGTKNPGYPDFTEEYFIEMNAEIEATHGGRPPSNVPPPVTGDIVESKKRKSRAKKRKVYVVAVKDRLQPVFGAKVIPFPSKARALSWIAKATTDLGGTRMGPEWTKSYATCTDYMVCEEAGQDEY